MQNLAWWAKLAFVLVNVAIASYFANPFAGIGEFFGWLISFGVSVLITGIVVSGLLLLVALLARAAAFVAAPALEKSEPDGPALQSKRNRQRITEQQLQALGCADAGRTLYPRVGSDDLGGDAYFDSRTLESLAKRGFLEGDVSSGYRITPVGRVCLRENL